MKLDKTGAEIRPFGYELDKDYLLVRKPIRISKGKDYGYDPLGDGKYKMIPTGDIVGKSECDERMNSALALRLDGEGK